MILSPKRLSEGRMEIWLLALYFFNFNHNLKSALWILRGKILLWNHSFLNIVGIEHVDNELFLCNCMLWTDCTNLTWAWDCGLNTWQLQSKWYLKKYFVIQFYCIWNFFCLKFLSLLTLIPFCIPIHFVIDCSCKSRFLAALAMLSSSRKWIKFRCRLFNFVSFQDLSHDCLLSSLTIMVQKNVQIKLFCCFIFCNKTFFVPFFY